MPTKTDPVPRAVAIVGLLGVGLIHLLDSIGKYSETRYLFWMYIGLIIGSIAVSGALLVRESRAAWAATGLLAAAALVGYVLSRSTGLPSAKGDVGNWAEPLGLASMFIEGCLVALAGYRLAALLHLGRNETAHSAPYRARASRLSVEQ
ncbi:MAG: hypothetical protein QOF55_905 [Thermoleophilaceae bacterium]|nr:hypothetical protein [Thermoleophilaceae bacterium]